MTDKRTVQTVIVVLGAFAIIGLLGIVYLLASSHTAAEVAPLATLTGPAVGAVAAVLVSTRSVDVQGLQDLADAQQGPAVAHVTVQAHGVPVQGAVATAAGGGELDLDTPPAWLDVDGMQPPGGGEPPL